MSETPRQARDFDLGDILTITDGRLLSTRHMEGVYDILNFMTGDSVFTHQIPRAMRVCGPALLRQYPHLADADRSTTITPETFRPWLDAQKRIYGTSLSVTPLQRNEWVSVDPLLEAQALVGKERVIAVDVSGEAR